MFKLKSANIIILLLFLFVYIFFVGCDIQREQRLPKLSQMLAERLVAQAPLRHDKTLSCCSNLYHFPANFLMEFLLRLCVFFSA